MPHGLSRSVPRRPAHLMHLVTSADTAAAFLRGQLRDMRRRGYEVTLVSDPGSRLDAVGVREDVATIGVAMAREPSPLKDALALRRLVQVLRRTRPDILHVGTPKASLLGVLAARMTRVPHVVMTLHGIRSEGLHALKNRVFMNLERLTCRMAHRVFAVGKSVRALAVQLRLTPASKIVVLGPGTANGIDATRFSRSTATMDMARRLRAQLRLPPDALVLGFVGRIVRDKGVGELLDAYRMLRATCPKLALLIIGPFEEYDGVSQAVRQAIAETPGIVAPGFSDDIVPYYALMDLLVLPTYREGFPYAPLEAAAMELPVVATRVTGCVDAVIDGVTGKLVRPRDVTALVDAIRAYLVDADLRRRHGAAGHARVTAEFRPQLVWDALACEYCALLCDPRPEAPTAEESEPR